MGAFQSFQHQSTPRIHSGNPATGLADDLTSATPVGACFLQGGDLRRCQCIKSAMPCKEPLHLELFSGATGLKT